MILAPLVRFVVLEELLGCEARVCHEGTAVGKKICEKCKIVRRKGIVRVICEVPKHKQRQG